VKKLRKNSEQSSEPTEVPADFEPQVIDETEDGSFEVITSAQPPPKTAKSPHRGRGSNQEC